MTESNSAQVRTWPMPSTEMASGDYSLEVAGTAVPVWLARVREHLNRPPGCGLTSMFGGPTEWCSFARFDADFPVDVAVTVQRPFEQAEVLPTSAGVCCEVDGDRVRFRLERPGPVTLCLDEGDEHPLHIFARAPETDRPDPDDPNVLYFGPGEHWVHSIRPQSGQTVYLDGGALVRATLPEGAEGRRGGVLNLVSYGRPVLDIDGVEDVRICGRGILDGTCLPHPAKNLVRVTNSQGVRIEGITLRNSPNWHLPIVGSEDVTVEDLAGISGRLNSDGVNCVSSSRVRVRRTFMRSHDDSFVVKTTNPDRPSADITYEGCVAWNDWGYGFGVSYETRADIRDIVFRDCDAISARNWPLGIHLSDSGTVGPVLFDRIGIHYLRASIPPVMDRRSIKLHIGSDCWGKDDTPGHVRDVTFRDVEITGVDIPPALIAGADAEHPIEDVTFENVRVNGHALASPDDPFFGSTQHVRNITVRP